MNDILPFTSGNFLIKLAETDEERLQTFRLRYVDLILSYNHFKSDNGEVDKDAYDLGCEHLIAIDLTTNQVVGTYRMIRKEHLCNLSSFLTESEFDITNLKNLNVELLEMGRAVVDQKYRSTTVLSLLWKGIIRYAKMHHVRYMIGTASFHGTDPSLYQHAFSYLYHYHLSPDYLQTSSTCKTPLSIHVLPKEDLLDAKIKEELPPLIRGYLNIGATIGKHAFIDHDFCAIDVFMILDINGINPRYLKKFLFEF